MNFFIILIQVFINIATEVLPIIQITFYIVMIYNANKLLTYKDKIDIKRNILILVKDTLIYINTTGNNLLFVTNTNENENILALRFKSRMSMISLIDMIDVEITIPEVIKLITEMRNDFDELATLSHERINDTQHELKRYMELLDKFCGNNCFYNRFKKLKIK